MERKQTLSARQQGINRIVAFTAKGNLEKLKSALSEGVNAGQRCDLYLRSRH